MKFIWADIRNPVGINSLRKIPGGKTSCRHSFSKGICTDNLAGKESRRFQTTIEQSIGRPDYIPGRNRHLGQIRQFQCIPGRQLAGNSHHSRDFAGILKHQFGIAGHQVDRRRKAIPVAQARLRLKAQSICLTIPG